MAFSRHDTDAMFVGLVVHACACAVEDLPEPLPRHPLVEHQAKCCGLLPFLRFVLAKQLFDERIEVVAREADRVVSAVIRGGVCASCVACKACSFTRASRGVGRRLRKRVLRA